MKILSINNNFGSVNFKERHELEFSPQEKLAMASYEPNKRFRNVTRNVAQTLLILPFLDTTFSFLAKNGPLSSRVKAGAITSGIWAAAGVSSALVFNTKKAVDNKLFADFNKKYPVLSSIFDFAMIFAVFKGITTVPSYLKSHLTKNNSKVIKQLNSIRTILNKSSFNKNIIGELNKYWVKNPYAAKSFGVLSKLVVPTVFVASVARLVNENINRKENISLNYSLINKVTNRLDNTKVVNS